MATVVPALKDPVPSPETAAQFTGRWEDRHAGIGGAVNLTTDEYLAVHGTSGDDSNPPIWVVLAALVIVPVTCHPVLTAAVSTVVGLSVLVAWWAGLAFVLGAAVILAAWRRWHRHSFAWLVGDHVRGWRRRRMYRSRWAHAWDRAGLGCRFDAVSPRRHRPRLLRLRSRDGIEHLHVELLPRQHASDVAARLADLAASFGQTAGWVTLDRLATPSHPERIVLSFTGHLNDQVDPHLIQSDPVSVRLGPPPPPVVALEAAPAVADPDLVASAGGEQ